MISAISHSDHRDLPNSRSSLAKPITITCTASPVNSSSTVTSASTSLSTISSAASPLSSPMESEALPSSHGDGILDPSDPPSSFGSMQKPASKNTNPNIAAHSPPSISVSPPDTPIDGDLNGHSASTTFARTTKASSVMPSSLPGIVPQPRAYMSGGLVSDHHQITDHPYDEKMTSDDGSSLFSDSNTYKPTESIISSIQEEAGESEKPSLNGDDGLAAHTFRPASSVPTMSLLYSDTAPRAAWRPQLESWLKKHHPSQLREVERATSPPPILDSLQSHWSYTAVNALHSAQIHEIKCQSFHHRRTLSTESGETDLIMRFSESAIEEEDEEDRVSLTSSPPKKVPHHVRKSSSQSGLRRRSYGARDLKPYSRTPPSPTVPLSIDQQRPRSNSHVVNRTVLTFSSGDPHLHAHSAAVHPSSHIPKARSASFSQGTPTNYQPLSPPSSPHHLAMMGGQAVPRPNQGSFPAHHTTTFHSKRRCISCGSDQSPCWRPSWSASAGQLCNSCGLRYKKTNARCLTKECGRIPAKGEWVSMKNLATKDSATGQLRYKCLYCNGDVEVGEKH